MTAHSPGTGPAKRFLFVMPLPPPWAGVEEISRMLAASSGDFDARVRIIKSNVRTRNEEKGRWDLTAVLRVAAVSVRLLFQLAVFRPHVLYMPVSQNRSGLMRDALYVVLGSVFGTGVVGHLHGSQLGAYLSREFGAVRMVLLFALRRLRYLIVCADAIGADVRPYVDSERVVVVYNGTDFDPSGVTRTVPSGRFRVAFMGHLSVAKGFFHLSEAMAAMMKEDPLIDFWIAGERVDTERNVSVAGGGATVWGWDAFSAFQSQNKERVRLFGTVTEIDKRSFFTQADVFVFPSFAEAFPVVILEALRTGLPLVTSPVGALNEVLIEKRNALFVPPGDVVAIASALRRLREDPDLRAKMSEENRRLSTRFTADRMVSQIAGVLDDAAGTRGLSRTVEAAGR